MPEKSIDKAVARILDEVRTRGDAAIGDFTRQFDGLQLTPDQFRVPGDKVRAALDGLSQDLREAMEAAALRIRRFHEAIKPQDHQFTGDDGEVLGEVWHPLASAGIYAPGGRAAYPSSVLMAAIPAQVAGVPRIVVTSPPGASGISPLVLAACGLLGIDEVYQLGGVQAIAALAFGTETIPPVDMIAGPGNAYVTCAKKLLYGRVGIDFLAGPSEVVVIADAQASIKAVALELLAQAEHDPDARVYCLCVDGLAPAAVRAELTRAMDGLPGYVASVLARDDVFQTFPTVQDAIAAANRIAPEHLALKVQSPRQHLSAIRCAGAVMLGDATPVPLGDYFAGPSHVLPTGGTARFSSGLGTQNFMRATHVIQANDAYLKRWGPVAARLAEAEGLEAHARGLLQASDQEAP